jgi:hypothetical protein
MKVSDCPKCGAPLSKGAQNCQFCGAYFPAEEPAHDHAATPGSLINCPDCGREISVLAVECPNCGRPMRTPAAMPVSVTWSKPDWGWEWKSNFEILGWPLIHIAFGRKDGKLRVAKGIIAIGQFARGVFILAQFGIAYIFGFGQFIAAPVAIAQFAGTLFFGLGQFATGFVAIGQFAFGFYALGQIGVGFHSWYPGHQDPIAAAFFKGLWRWLTGN